jgi:DNA-binding transcriptional LysR family regulator
MSNALLMRIQCIGCIMNLKHLQHVVALAETLNFHRAAERVHLSQPAFSRSIAAFEQTCGLRIFDRHGGSVELTSVGKQVVQRAGRLLLDARSLSHDLKLLRDAELGEVIFGAGPFSAAAIVAPVLRAFHNRYPKIAIRVEVNNWLQLLRMLQEEQIDFFIADTRALPPDEHIDVTSLGALPIGFFCCRQHPLLQPPGRRRRSMVSTDALLAYPLASVRIPPIARHELAASLGLPDGTVLPVQVECDDITLLKQLIPGTDIVLTCADRLVRDEVAKGTLVRLPIPNLPQVYGDWGIVKLAGRTLSPASQIVADALQATMADEKTAGRPGASATPSA